MSKFKKIESVLGFLYAFSPVFTFAQSFNLAGSTIGGVFRYIVTILSVLNPILFSMAFIVFFWGLSKFILNSDSKDEIEKGRSYMLWGVLALFILVSFRVIVSFISTDLGLGNSSGLIQIPNATP